MDRRSGASMVKLEEEDDGEGDGFQGLGADKHDT